MGTRSTMVEAVARKLVELVGVIGEQSHALHAQGRAEICAPM